MTPDQFIAKWHGASLKEQTIVIHTAFTGTVPEVHVLTLEDLRDAGKRRLLKGGAARRR